MSVSEILIKIVGIAIILAGFFMLMAAIGFPIIFALSIGNPVISAIVGVVLIGLGIYIVRGGTPTL